MKRIAIKVLAVSLLLPTMSFTAESGRQEREESNLLSNMNESQMKDFIESIDDVNKKHGEEEQTILHMVVKLDNLDLVRLLTEKNANLEQKNKAGDTPLDEAYWAKYQESEKIFDFLLDCRRKKRGQTE